MFDFHALFLGIATFGTSAAAGFVIGINLAQPVKKQIMDQIRHDLLRHLREVEYTERMRQTRGFNVITGGKTND